MPSASQANIFTCTFCFHLSQGPPHVIGRSARLACSRCHAALLDLSICWVCGELIFRGDECVSFGWCFWHRACYGCLLCGSRTICRGVPVRALFRDEGVEGGRDGGGIRGGVRGTGCGGREVTEAPLCAACVVEAEVDGMKEEAVVVKRGLRRVERADGGLTRRRWEIKDEAGGGDDDAAHPGGGDGAAGEGTKTANMVADFADASESVIWVDIFDPINGPSFKPSPLKPIPLFMQRPPNPTVEPQHRPSVTNVHLQDSPRLRSSASAPSAVCPPASSSKATGSGVRTVCPPATLAVVASTPRPPNPTRSRETRPSLAASQEFTGDVGPLDLRHKQVFTLVKEEPLKRPSSRLGRSSRRSDVNSSGYRTPPEYPDQIMRAPYPLPLSTVRAASPLPSHLTSHSQRATHAAPQSSEYLERYQPVTAPARTTEARRLRRVAASLSEEGYGTVKLDQPGNEDTGDWGRVREVGAELRRFFTGR